MLNNNLNGIAIILSALIAYLLPFELFLFAYAFIGPLHYLTELNWLNERRFFIQDSRVALILSLISFLLGAYVVANYFDIINTSKYFNKSYTFFILFATSLCTAYILKNKAKFVSLLLIVSGFVFLLVIFSPKFYWVALFIPTLIHVFVFTFFFMLYGGLKSRSKTQIALSFALILVGASLLITPAKNEIQTQNYWLVKYMNSGFGKINLFILNIFNINSINGDFISDKATRLQSFIAFAYTYHYANWFLKTKIISWDKALNIKKLIAISLCYIVLIGIYIYDYMLGLVIVYGLSLWHVLMELPLNIISIKYCFTSMAKNNRLSTKNKP